VEVPRASGSVAMALRSFLFIDEVAFRFNRPAGPLAARWVENARSP